LLSFHPFFKDNPWLRADDEELAKSSIFPVSGLTRIYEGYDTLEARVMMFLFDLRRIHSSYDLFLKHTIELQKRFGVPDYNSSYIFQANVANSGILSVAQYNLPDIHADL